MVIFVNGVKHYLRMSGLPRGVRFSEALVPRDIEGEGDLQAFFFFCVCVCVCELLDLNVAFVCFSLAAERPHSPGQQAQDAGDRFDSEGHSSGFDRLLKLFPNEFQQKREMDTASESATARQTAATEWAFAVRGM